MVDLSSLLGDEDLRRRYGTPTLDRAWDYVRRGHVLSCTHDLDSDGDLDMRGTVAGSTSAPYAVSLSVGADGDGVWVFGRCSCPVGEGCKHALARADHGARRAGAYVAAVRAPLGAPAVLAARRARRPGREDPGAHRPAPRAPGRAQAAGPVDGLPRLVARRDRARAARCGCGRCAVVPATTGCAPASPGPTCPTSTATARTRRARCVALNDLLSGHRAGDAADLLRRRRQRRAGVLRARRGVAGPPRRRGRDAAAAPGAGLVARRRWPTRSPCSSTSTPRPTRDAQLRLGVPLDGEWYGAADLDVLGEGGHAVALWLAEGDAWSVTLAALTAPPGPEVRRLLKRGDSVVVPAADRDDLVAEYLPRLQRHVPVISSDGSVAVPEPADAAARAHGHLGGGRRGAAPRGPGATGSARTTGSTRLSETRGLRGVRRARSDEQRAARRACELDDEQEHHLCRGHQRGHGAGGRQDVPRRARGRCSPSSCCPGCAGQVEIDEIGDQPRLPRARRRAGRPLRSRARPGHDPDRRTDWLDLEVEITVDGTPIALAHVLEALTKGMDRVILRSGKHLRIDRPEFAHLARLVEAAAELAEQPDGGVRVGHHDLGPVGRARRGGHRRRAGRPVGAGRAGAPRPWTRCPQVDPVGLKARAAVLPARRASAGWPTSGSPGSAGSSPTTWGSARRSRPWRSSRTPARTGRARSWWSRRPASSACGPARPRSSPPASTSGWSPSRRPGAGQSVAALADGRRRRGHLLHAVPARGRGLRRA